MWTQDLLQSCDTVIPASLLNFNMHPLLGALLASTARAQIRGRNDKKGFRVFYIEYQYRLEASGLPKAGHQWDSAWQWLQTWLTTEVSTKCSLGSEAQHETSHARSNLWHQVESVSSEKYDFVGAMRCYFGFIFIYFCCGLLWVTGFFGVFWIMWYTQKAL